MKILIELDDDSPEATELDLRAKEQDRSRTAQARKILRDALLDTAGKADSTEEIDDLVSEVSELRQALGRIERGEAV